MSRYILKIIKRNGVTFQVETDKGCVDTLVRNYKRLKKQWFGSTDYEMTFDGINNEVDGFVIDMKDVFEITWKKVQDAK